MKDILICSNLCKKINQKNILWNLDFCLKNGEFVAIEGDTGKTVFLNLIAGLDFPTSGSLLLDLEPIGEETQKQTAVLSQEDNSNLSKISIIKNIEWYTKFYGGFDATEANKLFKILDISKFAKLSELSYTQYKMAEFVFTVCRTAKVYLFDEPCFVLLDKKYQEIFSRYLKNILNSGKAVVLFTRNADAYTGLCNFDRKVILKNGRIFED